MDINKCPRTSVSVPASDTVFYEPSNTTKYTKSLKHNIEANIQQKLLRHFDSWDVFFFLAERERMVRYMSIDVDLEE